MSILLSVTELLPDFSHSNWNVWNAKVVVGDGSSWCSQQHQQQQARVRRHKLPRNAHQGKNSGHGAKVEKPIGWIGFYDGLFYIQIGAWPSFMAHLTSAIRNIHGNSGGRWFPIETDGWYLNILLEHIVGFMEYTHRTTSPHLETQCVHLCSPIL